jgi:hypothetical protein
MEAARLRKKSSLRVKGTRIMYSCYDAVLVYGWVETNDCCLNPDWLQKHGLEVFATSVVRNHMCEALYGIVVNVPLAGNVTVDPVSKALVDKLYGEWLEYHSRTFGEGLGFYLGVQGDFESEHSLYDITPGSDPFES